MTLDRRAFLSTAAAIPAAAAGMWSGPSAGPPQDLHVKISCNLYSFNDLLRDGTMTLEEVLQFCSDLGFAAVDPTGYYFPDYPRVPTTGYLNRIKRMAFLAGLAVSGTGVRNDFTVSDAAQRQADVRHVQRWYEAAARMGAPVLRVFAGHGVPEGYRREDVTGWVVESLQQCADYGEHFGVMTALQNHAEFLKTAAQVEDVLAAVDSEWLGLILDIGSLDSPDPYAEIARLAPHAVSWQIKENVVRNGEEEETDLGAIVEVLTEADYRGYLPIETLGPGDPREKVPRFLERVRRALGSI